MDKEDQFPKAVSNFSAEIPLAAVDQEMQKLIENFEK